jgi:hypothetical protein
MAKFLVYNFLQMNFGPLVALMAYPFERSFILCDNMGFTFRGAAAPVRILQLFISITGAIAWGTYLYMFLQEDLTKGYFVAVSRLH